MLIFVRVQGRRRNRAKNWILQRSHKKVGIGNNLLPTFIILKSSHM